MPKLYRVWHTESKRGSKFDTKEKTELSAANLKAAKQTVQDMFTTHRVTSGWLITK